jgi:hypothetical protein
MPWKLKLIEDKGVNWSDHLPGDMWYAPYYKEDWAGTPDQIGNPEGRFLSDRYLREDFNKRDPICIRLPDGHIWCIDQKSTNSLEGWQISGEVPNLTASPSILSPGYHGWLQNGVLSDDLEGRAYP